MPRRPRSWSAVRTDPDEGVLVVYAVFGRGDRDESVYAELGPEVVDLVLSVERPPGGQRASGHPRSVRLDLGQPLGGRLLHDPVSDATRLAFDGSHLVVPDVLPPGFRLGSEGGHTAAGAPPDMPSHWYRDYGPAQRDGTTVRLWQGQGAPYDLKGDEWQRRGHVHVGGTDEVTWRSRVTRGVILTWRHPRADADLTLHVQAAAQGDPLPTLAAFLDALPTSGQ